MSSKIVLPFASPLTANGLKVWLGSCEDRFENYEDTHDRKLVPKTHIHLTGAALTELQMAEWWALGKVEFLALPSWESFVKKDHRGTVLLLTNVACSGCSSAHISYTSSTGVSLLTSSTGNATTPSSLITPPKFLPITEEEKAALTAVRRCWNCHGKPMDPGWVPHQHHACLGNPTIGTYPGKDFSPLTIMSTMPTCSNHYHNHSCSGHLKESLYDTYKYPSHSGSMAAYARARSSSPNVQDEDTDSDLGLDN
ncbi:hypothetical protein BU17DRAFT_72088 [Hysterangium stoloniferum]|nr:hypothetical protein BU17DRAFT_72088 [Hysterangium stoloniferum]